MKLLAFLYGFVEEKVYIEQLIGYEVKGNKDKVLKLNKTLYKSKQAQKAYSSINGYFLRNEFIKCPNVYAKYVKI